MPQLNGKKIAFLATHGVEESELTQPWNAMRDAGAEVQLISLETGDIQCFQHHDKSQRFPVDIAIDQANASDYDALVLPGGVLNPDALRGNTDAVRFVRAFFEQHKPVAAICHGPVMLAEAGVLEGRTITSFPNIQTDMINAGAKWVNEECVCDEGLVTSRTPDDLDAFCTKAIEEFAEGTHRHQVASAA